jgi:hypothetical protein
MNRAVVAVGLALALAGCADAPDCIPGTLRLDVQLVQAAALSDTITIKSLKPAFTRSFPAKPVTKAETWTTIDLTFDGGYPVNQLITLMVSSSVHGYPLADASAQIHLLPGCTNGVVTLFMFPFDIPDGGAASD